MQILADENMPLIVVEELQSGDTTFFPVHALTEMSHPSSISRNRPSALITFDKDFREIVFRLRRTPRFGIVFFRLGLLTPATMALRIAKAARNPGPTGPITFPWLIKCTFE